MAHNLVHENLVRLKLWYRLAVLGLGESGDSQLFEFEKIRKQIDLGLGWPLPLEPQQLGSIRLEHNVDDSTYPRLQIGISVSLIIFLLVETSQAIPGTSPVTYFVFQF